VKLLPCVLLALLITACSQEGRMTVVNESGPDLELWIEDSFYILDDGQSVTEDVDIGRKFIFGPDEKVVLIEGEGYCKWPFVQTVKVDNDAHKLIRIQGDAGFVDVCNETGELVQLYLVPCDWPTWDYAIDNIRDGRCSSWQVEYGCWDLLVEGTSGAFEELGIWINPCATALYTISAPALVSKGMPPRGVSAEGVTPEAKQKRQVDTRAIGEAPKFSPKNRADEKD